jgi:hypothetical protein
VIRLDTLRALHEHDHDHQLAAYCACSTWARTPYKHGAVNKADQFVSISPGAVRETVRATLCAPAVCGVSPIWVISKISQGAYN